MCVCVYMYIIYMCVYVYNIYVCIYTLYIYIYIYIYALYDQTINLQTAAVSLFESSLVQLRSIEDLEGPECSHYY